MYHVQFAVGITFSPLPRIFATELTRAELLLFVCFS